MADEYWTAKMNFNDDMALMRSQGMRAGHPEIFYDGEGRMLTGSAEMVPYHHHQQQHQHPRDGYMSYDPRRSGSQGRLIPTRRVEEYRTASPSYTTKQTGYTVDSYRREGSVIVEERIVSHERPSLCLLLIVLIAAIFVLLIGVLYFLFCIDHFYYSLIWYPIIVLLFCIFGFLHRGIYRGDGSFWRNVGFIILGMIACVLGLVAAHFVVERLSHVNLQLAEWTPKGFEIYELDRYLRLGLSPRLALSNDYANNVWACYSMDWVALVLIVVTFFISTTTVVVGNNYYNSQHEYVREVEPFCIPSLFNPFGQVLMGHTLAFLGIFMKTVIYGNFSFKWQDTWAPVWTAIFPLVGGLAAGFAIKRSGLRYGTTIGAVAVIFEVLSILASLLSMGLIGYGIYENILVLEKTETMVETNFTHTFMIISVFVFVMICAVLIVNIVYSIAVMVRVISEVCRKNSTTARSSSTQRSDRVYDERRTATTREVKDVQESGWGRNGYRDDWDVQYDHERY